MGPLNLSILSIIQVCSQRLQTALEYRIFNKSQNTHCDSRSAHLMQSAPAGGVIEGKDYRVTCSSVVWCSRCETQPITLKILKSWSGLPAHTAVIKATVTVTNLTFSLCEQVRLDFIWRKLPASGSPVSLNLHAFRGNISNK